MFVLETTAFWNAAPCSVMETRLQLKLSHYTPWRRLRGEKDSSYSFLTSALDGGEWSASSPGHALASRKGPPVRTVQESGWATESIWTQGLEEKSFCLCRGSNPDRPVVQSIVRHYTDWANPAPVDETTWHFIPERCLSHIRRRENLKYLMLDFVIIANTADHGEGSGQEKSCIITSKIMTAGWRRTKNNSSHFKP
jgi:hypothetical protein